MGGGGCGWGCAGRGWDTGWAGLEVRLETYAAPGSGEAAVRRSLGSLRGSCHQAGNCVPGPRSRLREPGRSALRDLRRAHFVLEAALAAPTWVEFTYAPPGHPQGASIPSRAETWPQKRSPLLGRQ